VHIGLYWINAYFRLFSDTEIRKNIPQDFIRGYIAGDFAQVMDYVPDVHGKEICG
jgi:hypothetical protein